MHFTTVESYERYRTVFENDEVEISVDEYPFGVYVEIENKSTIKNPEDVEKRMREFVSFLKENYSNKTVGIVAHRHLNLL